MWCTAWSTQVMSKGATKMSLSMKDVDQESGEDLMPISAGAAARAEEMLRSNPAAGSGGAASNQSLKGLSGIKLSDEDLNDTSVRRPQKRLSSPERWEAQQLIASGVLKVKP
jgi:ATP-dependent RNA helicase DHX8/PRP22